MKKKSEPTLYEILKIEYAQASQKLQRAWDNFNMADKEYFEIANAEVNLAQMELDLLKQKILKL